ASSSASLAFSTLSTTSLTQPLAPDVVRRKPRIFTFASPIRVAMCASIPGRFSQRTVSSFTFGIDILLTSKLLRPFQAAADFPKCYPATAIYDGTLRLAPFVCAFLEERAGKKDTPAHVAFCSGSS